MAATIGRNAIVAGQRLRAHQFENTQFVRQLPYFAFIAVHQRGVDNELLVHRQVQRHVKRAHERIAAIRITAEIGFRHAGYQMEDAFTPRQDSGKSKDTMFLPGTNVLE